MTIESVTGVNLNLSSSRFSDSSRDFPITGERISLINAGKRSIFEIAQSPLCDPEIGQYMGQLYKTIDNMPINQIELFAGLFKKQPPPRLDIITSMFKGIMMM
jgi:hypothetical protein